MPGGNRSNLDSITEGNRNLPRSSGSWGFLLGRLSLISFQDAFNLYQMRYTIYENTKDGNRGWACVFISNKGGWQRVVMLSFSKFQQTQGEVCLKKYLDRMS